MTYQYSASARSAKGLLNGLNEDHYLIDETMQLYLVCDGVAQNGNGEIAVKICAQSILVSLQEQKELLINNDIDQEESQRKVIELIHQAAQVAAQSIKDATLENPELKGMATTLSLLLVVQNKAFIGHIGDSRIYLCRSGKFHQLTHDHTIGKDLFARGYINEDELGRHPFRNVLSKCISSQNSIQLDTLMFDLIVGDRILICSDGFYNTAAKDQDIWADSLIKNSDAACKRLFESVQALNPQDDLTLLLFQVHSQESIRDAEKLRTDEVNLKMETLQHIFLFQDLDLKELLKIMERVVLHEVAENTVLIEEGSYDTTLFMILSGSVMVSKASKHLATLHAGNHFGEMSFFEDNSRSANVIATIPTRLLAMTKEDFIALIQENPGLGIRLMWRVAHELSRRLASS